MDQKIGYSSQKKKNILNEIKKIFNANNFAITDLSHSRSIIEIEGNNAKEILKNSTWHLIWK